MNSFVGSERCSDGLLSFNKCTASKHLTLSHTSTVPALQSGKYFPNEISVVHMAAAPSEDKAKICDQKLAERLKVNKVWHQTVLKAISISRVCTLSSPQGSLDSNSNMRQTHTYTHTQTCKHIYSYQNTYIWDHGLFQCCIYIYTPS